MNERIEIINNPVPRIITTDEYDRIRKICLAAAHSKLLNTNSYDIKARTADAIFMAISAHEMGVPIMTGLRHMYVIDGKIGCTMQMLLAIAKRAGVGFEIPDVASVTDTAVIRIRRPGELEWKSYSYSMAMAVAAGLAEKKNWITMQKIMLIWRAVGVGIRFEIPDIIGGMYPLEELLPDATYDESGSPIGNIIAYNPPPKERREQKPPPPKQQAAIEDKSKAAPASEKAQETPHAVWPSEAEAKKLVEYVAFKMQIPHADVLKYAGMSGTTDISKETGWGKFEKVADAALVIKAAFEKEQLEAPPATPRSTSPYSTAPEIVWTAEQMVEMDEYVESNLFDIESDLPMLSEVLLKKMGVGGWLDFPEGIKDAKSKVISYVIAHNVPLIVTRAKYIKTEGAYHLLSNGMVSVRLYGSDQLREKDAMWESYVETLKDGKDHSFALDHMPDLVISEWEVRAPKDENKPVYNIVLKDGIYIPTEVF